MNAFVDVSQIRAVTRISPKMAAYHLKRALRNKFCRYRPSSYKNYIDRVSAQVPQIKSQSAGSLSLGETARFVAHYYCHEYAAHIDEFASGRPTYFGESVDFGEPRHVDWHHKLGLEDNFYLWRQKLAHMGFICPMLIEGSDRHLGAIPDLIEGFEQNATFDVPDCFASAWFPYSVSHRILSILSGYLVASAQRELPESLQLLIKEFLRKNVGFLLANIEHELKNNHVERNLAALCLYYSAVESVPEALVRQLDREVAEIVTACVLEDGMLAERSAMYQGLTVMALRVFRATEFLSESTRTLVQSRLEAAERAWSVLTHPDGQICLFNDSWLGEVPESASVVGARNLQSVEILPVAGFARLEAGDLFAVLDAGPIGPPWNPGHGHSDFLALEVDVAGRRFIVDPGTFQYSSGERRHRERSAQSHNGPAREGVEPVEYSGCFKVGRIAEAALVESAEAGVVLGRLPLAEGTTTRKVSLSSRGLEVDDRWEQNTTSAFVRLLIPAEWNLISNDEGRARFSQDGANAEIRIKHGTIERIEEWSWSRRYLTNEKALSLVLRPEDRGSTRARLLWEALCFNNKRA